MQAPEPYSYERWHGDRIDELILDYQKSGLQSPLLAKASNQDKHEVLEYIYGEASRQNDERIRDLAFSYFMTDGLSFKFRNANEETQKKVLEFVETLWTERESTASQATTEQSAAA